MNPSDLEPRVLQELDLEGLRLVWRRLYGPPPKLRSPELLRQVIGWRIEAEANPQLVAELRTRLAEVKSAPRGVALRPGDTLYREWLGQRHEVVVLEGGRFAYRGEVHASLSAVARLIAGSRWNGPRFFGLRDEP